MKVHQILALAIWTQVQVKVHLQAIKVNREKKLKDDDFNKFYLFYQNIFIFNILLNKNHF